jgi:hypothetical protein
MTTDIEILSAAIVKATKTAFIELFKNNEKYYYCVLLTTGEGLSPIISAWSWEALKIATINKSEEYAKIIKWSYADSPYYNFGYEYFDEVREIFKKRPNIDNIEGKLWEDEFELRLKSMELALKQIDNEGLFELNQQRNEIYINVELMPPDYTNTDRALRLNKKENIANWLLEAAED